MILVAWGDPPTQIAHRRQHVLLEWIQSDGIPDRRTCIAVTVGSGILEVEAEQFGYRATTFVTGQTSKWENELTTVIRRRALVTAVADLGHRACHMAYVRHDVERVLPNIRSSAATVVAGSVA